ncbi:unnamed protein product [Ilex paraguariensis]|uniref:Uncharacterized protein n=1 Tax=Ilex paraguariensis TaxID=185542 RepID=A0ABC8RIN0_9AQUA
MEASRKMTKEGSLDGSTPKTRAIEKRGKGPGDLLMMTVLGGAFISARGMRVLGIGGEAAVGNASGSRDDAEGASGDAEARHQVEAGRELGDTLGTNDNAEVGRSTGDTSYALGNASGRLGSSSGMDGASDALGTGPHGGLGVGPRDMLGEGARDSSAETIEIGIKAPFGRVAGARGAQADKGNMTDITQALHQGKRVSKGGKICDMWSSCYQVV